MALDRIDIRHLAYARPKAVRRLARYLGLARVKRCNCDECRRALMVRVVLELDRLRG